MILCNKKRLFLRVFIFSFFAITIYSCHSSKPGYNPYLRKKPLEKQYKANKRAVDRGTKNYSKQMRKNRKFLGIGKPADRPMGK